MIYRRETSFSIILIFIAFSFLGWYSIPFLSLSLDKELKRNTLSVLTYWTNASAQQVEQELTSILEGTINNMEGVAKISSISKSGNSRIEVEINEHVDRDQFRTNLSSNIRRLYTHLPKTVSYPKISNNNTSNEEKKAILIYTIRSNIDIKQVENYANNHIKTKLSFVEGLDRVEVYGGHSFETVITYDEALLKALKIFVQDIKEALTQQYGLRDIGWIKEDTSGYLLQNGLVQVRLSEGIQTPLSDIYIAKREGRLIKLGQIAKISQQQKSPSEYFRVNGQNAIHVILYALPKTNAFSLVKAVENEMSAIKKQLPNGYIIEESYKSTKYVEQELNKIYKRTLLTIFILLLFIVLVSFNVRYVILIFLSLFSSISISFLFYYLFGIDIHLYSLAGITISLGLIIDNSIVMSDHLLHQGNLKVFPAILASTLTSATSLVVIWFLPMELKLNLWDFAAIIIINLMVSLFVAFFFTPALMQRLKMKSKKKSTSFARMRILFKFNFYYSRILAFIFRFRKSALLLLTLIFGLPLFMLPSNIEEDTWMTKTYNHTIGSEWYIEYLKSPVNKYFGGSLRLFNFHVIKNSIYSKPEETRLYIHAALPKGGSIQQLNKVMENMEQFLLNYTDEIWFQSTISGPQNANIRIHFLNKNRPMFPYSLKSKIVSYTIEIGGVSWNVYGVGKGFSQSAELREIINYKLSLTGFNLLELNELSEKIKMRLEKNLRVKEVNTSANKQWWKMGKAYEYVGQVDIEKLNYRLISMAEFLDDIKQQSSSPNQTINILANGQLKEICLIPKGSRNKDKWSLLNVPNSPYKVGEFMNIKKREQEEAIYKENQSYIKLIDFKYIGSIRFANEFVDELIAELSPKLPLGYSLKPLQSYRVQKNAQSYTLAVLLIILIMYIICSIIFESLSWPFAIIFMVPFSFIGIFQIFYLFDINFDQGGYASFIIVSGLVVNSSIYLLNEFSNIKKRSCQSYIKIYLKAFNRKIIPIMLTIASTVLGLVPFIVLGQNEAFWFALAIGAIGGLVFSVFLILFYFPLFIFLLTK